MMKKVDDNRGVRGIIDPSTTLFRPKDYRQKKKRENRECGGRGEVEEKGEEGRIGGNLVG